MCSFHEGIILQGPILAGQVQWTLGVNTVELRAQHMFCIAFLFFILLGACANLAAANPTTAHEAIGWDDQEELSANLNDNIISIDNYTDCIDNDSAPTPCTGETASTYLELSVDASRQIVCPGAEFTYTIQICNYGSVAVNNIAVKDVVNQTLDLISVSPEPERDGLWYISGLEPEECFTIVLTVRVRDRDARFNGVTGVSGHGYVNIHNHYGTAPQEDYGYNLRSCVYVLAGGVRDLSSCVDVMVQNNEGTVLKEREHGSGSYDQDNIVGIGMLESGAIQYNSSLHATHSPSSFALTQIEGLSYDSRWTEDLFTNVQLTGGSTTESYRNANTIEKNSSVQLRWNASSLKTDSEFNGQARLGYIHKLSPSDLDPAMRIDFERVKPSFEAREDYIGNFNINATIDTFDFDASSNRSVSGRGVVSNDKRIGGASQRTYEYGTGSYKSEESVQASGNYISKEIQATYSPINYSYESKRAGRAMNISTKWGEGTWSQAKGVSFLGEEISGADYLDKKAIAQWQSDLESKGHYSGRGRLKVVLNDENQSEIVRLEEEYTGNYSSERTIHLAEMFESDMAHLYVKIDGRLVKEVTNDINMAKYSILIINDGYTDVGPILVRDAFPAGAEFVSSSVKPSVIGRGYANWTFAYLPMGQSLKIDFSLKPPKEGGKLINRVSASGKYDRRFVTAGNFSAIARASQKSDMLKIAVHKMARVDPMDSSIIAYRISVENQDDRRIVAKVTDTMPDGLVFLNSSIAPQNMTYDISWIILDIVPGETRNVDYLAQALWTGKFANEAQVDAYALDGSGKASVDAKVETNLSEATYGNYLSKYTYPSEWKPPEWGFNYSENIFNASSVGACAGGTCHLNADDGFKNIYGKDSGSDDLYGEYYSLEDMYGEDYIYGLDPMDDYDSTLNQGSSFSLENITDQEVIPN